MGGGEKIKLQKKTNWDQGWERAKKKVSLGWHMDRKEKPINAPSIHVGALVGAGSLWPFSASFWSLLYKAEWRGDLFCLILVPLYPMQNGGVAFSASFWDLYATQNRRGPIGGQHLLSTRIYSAKVHRTITEFHITSLQIYMNITPSKASLHYL